MSGDDPCFAESQLSLKCLDENNYDRDKCTPFFLNYRECKSFWTKVKIERFKLGLRPYLPEPKDRDKIKKIYQETRKICADPSKEES